MSSIVYCIPSHRGDLNWVTRYMPCTWAVATTAACCWANLAVHRGQCKIANASILRCCTARFDRPRTLRHIHKWHMNRIFIVCWLKADPWGPDPSMQALLYMHNFLVWPTTDDWLCVYLQLDSIPLEWHRRRVFTVSLSPTECTISAPHMQIYALVANAFTDNAITLTSVITKLIGHNWIWRLYWLCLFRAISIRKDVVS